jgi:catechol 2,3-dioxygenase-like lactoylglutathione lyase family enzyme
MMLLLDHVSIGVPDLDAARPFYDAIMEALGARKVYDRSDAIGYGDRCSATDVLSSCLAVYRDPNAVSASKRHWCFKASTREQVDRFHHDGLSTGGQSAGEPGVRAQYHARYYGAFLLDPAGNKVEAVCHA